MLTQTLTWQLRCTTHVSAGLCAQAWSHAKRTRNDELRELVLSRTECPGEILDEAEASKNAVQLVALLGREDFPSARVDAILAAETRANVLVGALGHAPHQRAVVARAVEVFTTKPTIALARELVGHDSIPHDTRVEAALLLVPRLDALSGELQGRVLSLPSVLVNPTHITRFALAVEHPLVLERFLGAAQLSDEIVVHLFTHLVHESVMRAGRMRNSWERSGELTRARRALHALGERAAGLPACIPLAEEVQASALLGGTESAILDQIVGAQSVVAEVATDYPTRVSTLIAERNDAEARTLLGDPECPRAEKIRLAPLCTYGWSGQNPEHRRILHSLAGDDELLLTVCSQSVTSVLSILGWEGFTDVDAAQRQIMGALDARGMREMIRHGHSIEPALLALVSWSSVRAYSAYSGMRGDVIAEGLARLQQHALGDDPARWEVYASLVGDFEGSVGELLESCCAVLGAEFEAYREEGGEETGEATP